MKMNNLKNQTNRFYCPRPYFSNTLLDYRIFPPFVRHASTQSFLHYVPSKNKAITKYYSLYEFDLERICGLDIEINTRYIVYVKVRHSQDTFYMLGNQFGFLYRNKDDLVNLYYIIMTRLQESFEVYSLADEDIVYIQVSFKVLVPNLLPEIDLDKPNYINREEINKVKDTLKIPITTSKEYIGEALKTYTENNMINSIDISINNKTIDFLNVIKQNINDFGLANSNKFRKEFDSDFKFYLVKDINSYVLAIKKTEGFTEKIKYSLSGVVISQSIDSLDGESITRKIGGKEVVFMGDNVLHMSQKIKLLPLSKPKKNLEFINNPNIGVIDTETFTDIDDVQKIYALGFMTNLQTEPTIYYIDDKLDSDKIVLDMINELLRGKYNKTNFYCHNLGGYDVLFLLKVLTRFNDNNIEKYKLDFLLRDDKIITLTISKGKNKIKIRDSYTILSDKLETLANNLEVSTKKTIFPYKFSLDKNLFYIGNTPSIEYYNNITKEEYNNLYTKNWSFKDETMTYLKNDLNCLYQVITKASKQLHMDYDIELTDKNTISGLALNLFLKNYYKKNIPHINRASMYRDIKKGYYGGITEVYRPEGYDLFYYDVNSLYPYVALQDMPGLECEKLTYYTPNSDIDTLFGFFYCKIEAPQNSYLGILPVRDKSGISFPVGKWEGWYFSEELKLAKENGYKISVYKGYKFNREANVFKDYINKVYNVKSTAINKTQKSMAKSLLNNLLGRFGISLAKPITKIVNEKSFNDISLVNRITSYKYISSNKILVSYVPSIDQEIVESNGLDFIKLLNNHKHEDVELSSTESSSIVISAAVTAYGRIHMTRLKLDILKEGGKIYYSDTDSIVTDRELSNDLISKNELGKLKLEHKIDKGIFISGKTYFIANDEGIFINKAKGIKSSSLSYIDYMNLLNNKDVSTAIKTQSIKDWVKGDVKITDKLINISSNAYTKRSKIFKDNKWIDTKPLSLNTCDTSVITYENKLSLITIPKDTIVLQSNMFFNIKWMVYIIKNLVKSVLSYCYIVINSFIDYRDTICNLKIVQVIVKYFWILINIIIYLINVFILILSGLLISCEVDTFDAFLDKITVNEIESDFWSIDYIKDKYEDEFSDILPTNLENHDILPSFIEPYEFIGDSYSQEDILLLESYDPFHDLVEINLEGLLIRMEDWYYVWSNQIDSVPPRSSLFVYPEGAYREVPLYTPSNLPQYELGHTPGYTFELRNNDTNLSIEQNRELNRIQNDNAFRSNSTIQYDIFHLGNTMFIVLDQSIIDSSILSSLNDVGIGVEYTSHENIRSVNVTIHPEVASSIFSSEYLFPGITEERERLQIEYENDIRRIRTQSHFSWSDVRSVLDNASSGDHISIIDVPPQEENVVSENNFRDLLDQRDMRVNWRERIQILFTNQNPDIQPLPSWSEVPTRPEEPWGIEQWERDNVMRRYWSERLNGGYIQTNIFVRESPYESLSQDTPDDSLDWFYDGFDVVEEYTEKYDIYKDDDLCISKLFD